MIALLLAAFAAPWLLLLLCLVRGVRARMLPVLPLAPLPALAAALLVPAGTALTLERPVLPVTLALDRPGGLLLGVAALLWIAGGLYAAAAPPVGPAERGRWVVCWLLTLAGNVGVFLAADVTTFFLAYALVSIPAWGLVRTDAVTGSARAGAVYIGFALLGETLLLLGLVMLVAGIPSGRSIGLVMAALPDSPWRAGAIVLLTLGLGAKIGLVPLHSWMPLAYRAAPVSAAAVLSGAASKAGIIGLIRFLPLGVAVPSWGGAMTALGLFSAFYGVAIGLTQRHPKAILAYSSISQFGLMTAATGMALATGNAAGGIAVAFYAAHHVLAKGALFLAVGVASGPARRSLLIPTAVVALGIAGLPLTGGAVAKLALKPALGYGVVGLLGMLSAAGSTLLMLHFLRRLAHLASREATAAPCARLAWLAATTAAIVVPWALLAWPEPPLSVAAVLSLPALWDAAWPLLLGGALAALLHRWRPPAVPAGDIIVLGRALRILGDWLGAAAERTDAMLRRWPVATVGVLVLALLLWLATGR